MDANTLIAISSIVTPLSVMVATIIVARMQYYTKASVDLGNLVTNHVHDVVCTDRKESIAELVERNEDRHVAAEAAEEANK